MEYRREDFDFGGAGKEFTEETGNRNTERVGNYELLEIVGRGGFGKVYRAREISTGEIVAVKSIYKRRLSGRDADRIEREINAMLWLNHPYIVRILDVINTDTKICMVMEFVGGGEMYDLIVASGKLPENIARIYFQQLVCAVGYCHARGVYHRDLKPENLLIDGDGNLKVTDFGLCALPVDCTADGLLNTYCGTDEYGAPEIVFFQQRGGYAGDKADVWSCGVILYVMLTGNFPFFDDGDRAAYQRGVSRAEFDVPDWFSGELRQLLSMLLEPDPRKRISVEQITCSPWFRHCIADVAPLHDMEGDRDNDVEKGCDDDVEDGRGDNVDDLYFLTRVSAWEVLRKIGRIGIEAEFYVTVEGLKVVMERDISNKIEGVVGGESLVVEAAVMEFDEAELGVKAVVVTRRSGNSMEFLRFREEVLRPGIKDIVDAW